MATACKSITAAKARRKPGLSLMSRPPLDPFDEEYYCREMGKLRARTAQSMDPDKPPPEAAVPTWPREPPYPISNAAPRAPVDHSHARFRAQVRDPR